MLASSAKHGGTHDLSALPLMSSAQARERVAAARELQAARLKDDGVTVNAQMDARMLRRHATLRDSDEQILRLASQQGMLSACGQHRVLRVARTIADLNGSARIQTRDLGTAIALRPDASLVDSRAA